ncbi:MAG: caspase family protein [Geminicoccaceae bacterium]|nr:caspase family protein [Geminicoccaceae bacterium]
MPARLGPLVALLVGLALSSPVAAGGRMALVVGNQDYAALPDLPNAADARLVAERLERIGFAVELASDVDRAGLARALDRFLAGVPGKERPSSTSPATASRSMA